MNCYQNIAQKNRKGNDFFKKSKKFVKPRIENFAILGLKLDAAAWGAVRRNFAISALR
ncbi:MAG: hypothetical protein GXO74_15715 [Calditrichaeota bacterium]|nr:hypothetical protein [Calditrichota bacterium]